MANDRTKRPAPRKNKPRFFSVLLTLVFIAAGIFGIYKVRSLLHTEPASSFLQEGGAATSANTDAQTSEPEPTTTSADEDAIAAAKAIGEADDSLSPAFLSYIAENCDAESLQTVLAAMEKKDYDKQVWFTATGASFHALNALANGDVEKGLVREIEGDKDTIEIGFAGKVNAAREGTAAASVSADLQKLMQGMDIQMLNSECLFSADGKTAEFMTDAKTAAVYKQLGVDVVTVANNHMTDYGADAIAQTRAALQDNDVSPVGAGADVTEAAKPVCFLAGGRKIAFLAAADTVYWRNTKAATASSAGVFSLRSNFDAVKNAVKDAKADNDYVFVYIHAGIDENANWFDSDQDTWSKRLIDAGADGVIGARSNRMQGMEFYKGKLIAYGLGDFLYDGKDRETGVYTLSIDQNGAFKHTLYACTQSDGKVALCTSDADKSAVFNRVSKFCGNVVKISSDGTIRSNRG